MRSGDERYSLETMDLYRAVMRKNGIAALSMVAAILIGTFVGVNLHQKYVALAIVVLGGVASLAQVALNLGNARRFMLAARHDRKRARAVGR